MPYTIKTYQDGFIEQQFAIGSKVYDPWPMGGQTRPDQLKQAYSADAFDPETRFYAFLEDKMVGFLTSSLKGEEDGDIEYFFEFPYVLEEHRPEAEIALIDHAIAALKDKGATVLVARAGEYWGKSQFWAEEYNFTKQQDIARRGEIDIQIEKPEDYGDASKWEDYEAEKHLEAIASIYAKRFGAPIEKMKQQLQQWNTLSPGASFTSPWDHTLTVLSHKIMIEEGEVTGRLVAMNHSNFGEETINLSQLVLSDTTTENIGAGLAELVRAGQQFDKTTAVLHTGQWGVFPSDSNLEQFNIEFDMKLAFYEKEL